MTRKEIYKKIKWLAKELPPDKYEVNGKEFPVNHENRLKALWNRYKIIQPLNEYFWKYGLELKTEGKGINADRDSKEIPNR